MGSSNQGPPYLPHYAISGRKKGVFSKFVQGFETLVMTSEGLGEMFEGDSADMCSGKFPLVSMGGQAEGLECADLEARTPIGVSRNSTKVVVICLCVKDNYLDTLQESSWVHSWLHPLPPSLSWTPWSRLSCVTQNSYKYLSHSCSFPSSQKLRLTCPTLVFNPSPLDILHDPLPSTTYYFTWFNFIKNITVIQISFNLYGFNFERVLKSQWEKTTLSYIKDILKISQICLFYCYKNISI